jgi:tellurium resistance protein TerD
MLEIIEKGATFELDVVSKQEGPKTYYFGAGWDNPNGPVDLDIVCALLKGGKLAGNGDFVYFGNRNAAGVALSEDNQTGEGDGDDENIVINTAEVASDVDSIVIGLAAYAGADLHSAPNPHFRVCDGAEESSEQIGDVVVTGGATAGDTVLVAFTLTRGADGWSLENNAEFHKKGQGTGAIQGFGALFQ